jgi:predicted AAA+ superfamily ATPase
MYRFITKKLLDWKKRPNRKPLILRGARQVGKTHTVLEFGREHFKGKVHVVDLEKHPDWHHIFDRNLVAKRILSELEILVNARITPGD